MTNPKLNVQSEISNQIYLKSSYEMRNLILLPVESFLPFGILLAYFDEPE